MSCSRVHCNAAQQHWPGYTHARAERRARFDLRLRAPSRASSASSSAHRRGTSTMAAMHLCCSMSVSCSATRGHRGPHPHLCGAPCLFVGTRYFGTELRRTSCWAHTFTYERQLKGSQSHLRARTVQRLHALCHHVLRTSQVETVAARNLVLMAQSMSRAGSHHRFVWQRKD